MSLKFCFAGLLGLQGMLSFADSELLLRTAKNNYGGPESASLQLLF